jgi:hypothetical protein
MMARERGGWPELLRVGRSARCQGALSAPLSTALLRCALWRADQALPKDRSLQADKFSPFAAESIRSSATCDAKI